MEVQSYDRAEKSKLATGATRSEKYGLIRRHAEPNQDDSVNLAVIRNMVAEPVELLSMAVEESGGGPVYGVALCAVVVPESRKLIPNFEEIIKNIDDAIHSDPGFSNSKFDVSEITLEHVGNSCNLTDIEVTENDPCNRGARIFFQVVLKKKF